MRTVQDTELQHAAAVSMDPWWMPPLSSSFALRSSGHSGFGAAPYVGSPNQLLLRVVVPATISNLEGAMGGG